MNSQEEHGGGGQRRAIPTSSSVDLVLWPGRNSWEGEISYTTVCTLTALRAVPCTRCPVVMHTPLISISKLGGPRNSDPPRPPPRSQMQASLVSL